MFHVIEHFREPESILAQCYSLLRTDGVLVLKTPNVRSLIAKTTGAYWGWSSPPAHIHLFAPQSLRVALSRNGFHIQHLATQRGDSGNNFYELLTAARRRLKKAVNTATGAEQPSRKLAQIAQRLTEIMYFPLSLTLDPILRGWYLEPELIVLARKKIS